MANFAESLAKGLTAFAQTTARGEFDRSTAERKRKGNARVTADQTAAKRREKIEDLRIKTLLEQAKDNPELQPFALEFGRTGDVSVFDKINPEGLAESARQRAKREENQDLIGQLLRNDQFEAANELSETMESPIAGLLQQSPADKALAGQRDTSARLNEQRIATERARTGLAKTQANIARKELERIGKDMTTAFGLGLVDPATKKKFIDELNAADTILARQEKALLGLTSQEDSVLFDEDEVLRIRKGRAIIRARISVILTGGKNPDEVLDALMKELGEIQNGAGKQPQATQNPASRLRNEQQASLLKEAKRKLGGANINTVEDLDAQAGKLTRDEYAAIFVEKGFK